MVSVPIQHKIILGIDYGTTYSGVSYVTTDKKSINDIVIVSAWPGDSGANFKAPTRIAYQRENPKFQGKGSRWGFEVDPKFTSYSWTKLLLDKSAAKLEYDDPTLSEMAGPGMLRLPHFRDAAGVCEDFLRELYQHVSRKLRQEMTDVIFDTTPMECWITLPAIWSDEAQDATLKAAKNAGFGNRAGDEIFTITEPEAAAIATLTKYSLADCLTPIKPGENILICDCGGGTVDITTYTITQVSPVLQFDELCVGAGGKCGSSYIDRNLHALLSRRFGAKFDNLNFAQKGPGSKLMTSFERRKKDFGLRVYDNVLEIGPVRLDVPDSDFYDEEERMVKLTFEDMQSLFDPVIAQIRILVSQQVTEAKEQKNATINRIILVGGFAESAYLHDALTDWCKRKGDITLIRESNPQSAIVRGAALRGLQNTAPRVRYSRKHYGVPYATTFREGIDPEWRSSIDRMDNKKLCNGRMSWLISKGDEIVRGTRRSVRLVHEYQPGQQNSVCFGLYASSLATAPEYVNRAEKVGVIHSTFAPDFDFGSGTTSKYNTKLGEMVYQFPLKVQVVFGDKGTNLLFENIIDGKTVSKATIKFDQQ